MQISSGRGPVEVRRFVAALATRLRQQLEEHGAVVEEEGQEDPPASVLLRVEGLEIEMLQPWLGTHTLLAALRGKGSRKRWFAEISLQQPAVAPVLDPQRLRLRACRAQGPGGQKVNKTSSAVRLSYEAEDLSLHLNNALSSRTESVPSSRSRACSPGATTRPRRSWRSSADSATIS
jgi:peptide chain release factor 2/peptide chain release factor